MDRLKLETVYLRALDALMSAADEYQIQAAILRLRQAQARLHGWKVQGSPPTHSYRRRASLPVHLSPHSVRPPKAA
jgi:2-keto-4-pentenoate hydratase